MTMMMMMMMIVTQFSLHSSFPGHPLTLTLNPLTLLLTLS